MPRLINIDRMPSRTKRPPRESLPPWRSSIGATRLLQGLVRYRYLTPQLAGYWIDQTWGRGGYQAQHELKRLWDYELVDRIYRPVEPGAGSSQYVYVPTLQGAEAILAPKDYARVRREIGRRARRPLVLFDHALAVALLQILWDLGAKENPLAQIVPGGYWVDRDPSDVVGRGFRVLLKPDTESPAAKQGRLKGPHAVTLFPDTVALLQWKDYTWPVYFEIERTHKNDRRERERFRAYGELLTRQRHAAADVFEKAGYGRPRSGMVVFIAASDAHAISLWGTARRAVASLRLGPKDGKPAMLFGGLDSIIAERREELRSGRTRVLEEIIEPAAFFSEKLFAKLEDGKRQPLLVRY
jgi:hypothetical protein